MTVAETIDYMKLPTILKRYKFEDKMRYAEEYSRMIMQPDVQCDPGKIRKLILPWELECYVMLSVKASEWKFDDLSQTEFLRIMNSIRQAKHPKLQIKTGSEKFAQWLIMVLASTQFDYEESYWNKMFRFSYYFSYVGDGINMPEEFKRKFGIEYQNILTFTWSLWMLYITNAANIEQCKRELIDKHSVEVGLLTINREEYISELNKVTPDLFDYIYCLRPSYSFPFIQYEGKLSLPLPHLLVRASTSSLMFRLTSENNALREKIGHKVFESYLLHILSTYPEFECVKPEIIYSKGKLQNQRSVDVMALAENQIFCFDSKSFSPKTNLRVFSEEAYSDEVARLGKSVKQMYEHIHNKFGIEYNPFEVTIDKDRSNIWGLVIVSENPFISLSDIYANAVKQLNIQLSTDEYEWLQGHVGIVSLSALEYQIFSCDNILAVVQQNALSKNYEDHWFSGMKETREADEISEFKDRQLELSSKLLRSLECVVDN